MAKVKQETEAARAERITEENKHDYLNPPTDSDPQSDLQQVEALAQSPDVTFTKEELEGISQSESDGTPHSSPSTSEAVSSRRDEWKEQRVIVYETGGASWRKEIQNGAEVTFKGPGRLEVRGRVVSTGPARVGIQRDDNQLLVDIPVCDVTTIFR